VIAIVVMFAGIGFVGLLTAAVAQRFIAYEVEHEVAQVTASESEILQRLDEIARWLGALEQQQRRS